MKNLSVSKKTKEKGETGNYKIKKFLKFYT